MAQHREETTLQLVIPHLAQASQNLPLSVLVNASSANPFMATFVSRAQSQYHAQQGCEKSCGKTAHVEKDDDWKEERKEYLDLVVITTAHNQGLVAVEVDSSDGTCGHVKQCYSVTFWAFHLSFKAPSHEPPSEACTPVPRTAGHDLQHILGKHAYPLKYADMRLVICP